MPVTIVDDLTDYGVSGGRRACRAFVLQGGVAAELSIAVLVNATSQSMVVKRVHMSTIITDQTISVHRPDAAIVGLTNTADKSFTDFSIPGRPQAQLGQDTVAALVANRIMWSGRVLGETVKTLELDVTLFGGAANVDEPGGAGSRALMVSGGTVNTSLLCAFEWEEGVEQG